jgi:uncharacterized membrane protein YgdD (TMEM256/DUF423 family)
VVSRFSRRHPDRDDYASAEAKNSEPLSQPSSLRFFRIELALRAAQLITNANALRMVGVVIMVLGFAVVFSGQIYSARRESLERWGARTFLGGLLVWAAGFRLA